jgi:hypothetical protein
VTDPTIRLSLTLTSSQIACENEIIRVWPFVYVDSGSICITISSCSLPLNVVVVACDVNTCRWRSITLI